MYKRWLILTGLWVILLLWRILALPYPAFLPYALIGLLGLGVALALVTMMRRLLALPEALLDQLEVR